MIRRGTPAPRGRSTTRRPVLLLLAAALPLLAATPGAATGAQSTAAVADGNYSARYLVRPNPLPAANGLALDGRGHLYVAQALYNRVTRIDLATGAAVRIADDTDPAGDSLQSPDDIAVGPDGNLYVTNSLHKSVVRMAPDGSARTTIASGVTDGVTGPNGIAFAPDGRLWVSDLAFDPAHPGGLWQVDPRGTAAPTQLTHGLQVPEGFGTSSDGRAYVPEYYAGRIAVVDPANPASVTRLSTRFEGLVSAVKVTPKHLDPAEPLVLVENLPGRGNVWRVDRTSGAKTLLATGSGAYDNLAVDPASGTIYVSDFVQGGIQRVDPRTRTLTQLFPNGPVATPTSLSLNSDGSLLVAGATSLARVSPRGQVTTLSKFLVSGNQGVTPGAVQVGNALYYTDWLDSSRPGRLMKRDLGTGAQTVVATGFVIPWHVRQGPAGSLLLSDEVLGNVYRIDLADGTQTVIASGLNSPAGLAYDARAGKVYIAEAGAGRVVAVPARGGTLTTVADNLAKPEGVTLDGRGRLLVVDANGAAAQNPAAPGSLLRVVPGTASRTTLATGLPTKLTGITLIPGFTYTSDVVARPDGSIVVSGAANGSLIQLTPNR
ncbi:SMP-30/gluconolactonase/LRE family protein [Streptomycetaceae bacterium NBC_01309]